MLGAKPVKTQTVPVIFEPAVAAGLAAGILGALDGDMVFKKASFLTDKLGETIACERLSVIDDPLLKRGAGTAPFDGEGLPTFRKAIVDAGKLTTYLYDSYTARKAGVKPTSSARRGFGGLAGSAMTASPSFGSRSERPSLPRRKRTARCSSKSPIWMTPPVSSENRAIPSLLQPT